MYCFIFILRNPFTGRSVLAHCGLTNVLTLLLYEDSPLGLCWEKIFVSVILLQNMGFLESDADHIWVITYKFSTKCSSFMLFLTCDSTASSLSVHCSGTSFLLFSQLDLNSFHNFAWIPCPLHGCFASENRPSVVFVKIFYLLMSN